MNLNTLTPYFKVIADAQSRALDGTCYVVRGCAPTANGAGLRVDVAAGDTVEGGTPHYNYAGGNVTCTAASSAASLLARRDIVYRSSAGTLTVTAGTAALVTSTTPVPPALPASATLIAVVFIAPGQITLAATDVEDVRQIRTGTGIGLDVRTFGAKGDGTTDDTAAIQAAVDAAAGGVVDFGPGTFVITSRVSYVTTTNFAPGVHLRGAGMGKTIIDNRVAANSCFYFAGAANQFQFNPSIEGMTIMTTTSPATSNGVELFAAYHATIKNMRIVGMTGDGIRITMVAGDPDGSVEVLIENCRVESCNYGLNCNATSGTSQISYLTVRDSYFVSNTTAGVRYIGFAGLFSGNSFVTNTGPGMQVIYNATNCQMLTMLENTWENNGGTPSLDIQGLTSGFFAGNEFALTTSPGAGTAAVYMAQSGSGSVQNVVFDSTYIRIGAGFTPYTFWTMGAAASRNRIRNTRWQTYDAVNQVRYSDAGYNMLDDSWAQYQHSLATPNITCVNGANQNVAVPAEGTVFSLSGPTGAFNVGGFVSPVGPGNGREIILANETGFTLTLNSEDGGSTAANRLRMESGVNVTLGTSGTVRLIYSQVNNRWRVVGKG